MNLRPKQGSSSFPKNTSTIQYGYRKCETHARVFPKHSRMGTERIKYDKETEKDGKKSGVSMERTTAGIKNKRPERPITT